jgi:hypothetical protein
MTLREVTDRLGMSVLCAHEKLAGEVTGAYCGDLLSDVMAHSRQGQVWITIQVHVNIVAVAVLKELAAIIVVNGRRPAADTLTKAAEEKVPIVASDLTAYEISGKLHALGLGGERSC